MDNVYLEKLGVLGEKNQEFARASWFSRSLNGEGALPPFIVECYGDIKDSLLAVNKPVAALP